MKVTTIEIKGRRFDIEVSTDGTFEAVLDGERMFAKTLDDLKDKLLRHGRTQIAVPVVRWRGVKLEKGHITGVHGSNGNYLIKWTGEKGIEQISPWSLGSLFQLEDAEQSEYESLQLAASAAESKVEAFQKDHRIDHKKIVDQALNQEKGS